VGGFLRAGVGEGFVEHRLRGIGHALPTYETEEE
jgi:hypothetical protein